MKYPFKYVIDDENGIVEAMQSLVDNKRVHDEIPTTVKEFLLHYMVQNGMFLSKAQEVFDIFSSQDHVKDIRWDASLDYYPDAMLAILQLCINSEVVMWIDKNLPNAYFRPMFV